MMRENTECVAFSSCPSSWETTLYQDNYPTSRQWENTEFGFSPFSLVGKQVKRWGTDLKNLILRNKTFEYWGEANFGQL